MNLNNEEEVLGLLTRLLDQLRQADLKNFGSKIEIVYVASGGQHVENLYNGPLPSPPRRRGEEETHPQPPASPLPPPRRGGEKEAYPDPPEGREKGMSNLPEVLATDKAMALWRKAQQAGYVGEQYLPLISRTQAALLADAMAERLGIKEKWKVFEGLWNRKYMRSDYNLALTRKRTLDFQDELKRQFD